MFLPSWTTGPIHSGTFRACASTSCLCIAPACHSSHHWSCSFIQHMCPPSILSATVRSPPSPRGPFVDCSWTAVFAVPGAASCLHRERVVRAFERRPTVHRDGLPLHERARRAISRREPRAGGKGPALSCGKPRDQGASTNGWIPTAFMDLEPWKKPRVGGVARCRGGR